MTTQIEILNQVEKFIKENKQSDRFIPGKSVIPPSGKLVDHEEVKNIVEAAIDGWLTTGRFNNSFEKQLSKFIGVKHLLTCNSGSSANLLAFAALTSDKLGDKRIRPGDEIISVAAGFPTTVNPIIQFGCIPIFFDINLSNYNIKTDNIEQSITPKTKAIFLAHTLGNPFDVQSIVHICKKYDLWLIEDCCDALGSKYNDQNVGTFGDIGTLSFYPAHHITMGEGGAVFMNSGRLKKIVESFRDWGRDCYCPPGVDNTCNNRYCWTSDRLGGSLPDGYDHKYIYSHLGFNLKITDMQAACGLAQLNKLSLFIQKRKENFIFLKENLKHLDDFLIFSEPTNDSDPSWFGFPVTLRDSGRLNRVILLDYLNSKKIGTRLLFAGNLTRQPYMHNKKFRIAENLHNTEIVMKNTFWLGVQPALNHQMLEYVVDSMTSFFKRL